MPARVRITITVEVHVVDERLPRARGCRLRQSQRHHPPRDATPHDAALDDAIPADAAVEFITKPEIVQRYVDEGFLEYGDGREVFFDKERWTLILVGEAVPSEDEP